MFGAVKQILQAYDSVLLYSVVKQERATLDQRNVITKKIKIYENFLEYTYVFPCIVYIFIPFFGMTSSFQK